MQMSLEFVDGTLAHAEAAIRWLKFELNAEQASGGFYHNRSIIRRAAREGEFKCLLSGRNNLGFAVFTFGQSRVAIDILAIRTKYQRRGYGSLLANSVINMLFQRGAPHIEVECSPHESVHFWRALGFTDSLAQREPMANPRLILPA